MKFIRFPGDPAIPAAIPLVQSLVLSEFEWLVAKDVADTASRGGEMMGLLVGSGRVGLLSSKSIGGEGLGGMAVVPFAFPFLRSSQSQPHAVGDRFGTYGNLTACFVTAATTPPPSLPFFLSFLETDVIHTHTVSFVPCLGYLGRA